jgi:uncharacterized protein (TIGR02246 family)
MFASTGAAAETPRAESCRKGEDVRRIEVVAPGRVGLACDVVYSRDGGLNVAVPYNANVDSDFCRARAAELAANLTAEGFFCDSEASDAIEAALAGGPETLAANDSPPLDVQLQRLEQATAPAESDELSSPPPAAAVPVEPELASMIEPAPAKPDVRPVGEAAAPVQLASNPKPSEFKAPLPPRAKGPGRLVGAQPSIEDIIDIATAPAATVADGAVAMRASEDIIRGVLAANAAAWNEGSLDAFVSGYANTPDLLVLRGAAVTTGWKDARKALEEQIAASGGMGRLSYKALDVRMTSDDVATVVGRYALTGTKAASAGVTTLVMKQIEGRWRIVQDTRIVDVPPKE